MIQAGGFQGGSVTFGTWDLSNVTALQSKEDCLTLDRPTIQDLVAMLKKKILFKLLKWTETDSNDKDGNRVTWGRKEHQQVLKKNDKYVRNNMSVFSFRFVLAD